MASPCRRSRPLPDVSRPNKCSLGFPEYQRSHATRIASRSTRTFRRVSTETDRDHDESALVRCAARPAHHGNDIDGVAVNLVRLENERAASPWWRVRVAKSDRMYRIVCIGLYVSDCM